MIHSTAHVQIAVIKIQIMDNGVNKVGQHKVKKVLYKHVIPYTIRNVWLPVRFAPLSIL